MTDIPSSEPDIRREFTARVNTQTLEYVMSDDTLDGHGTVIEPSGWDLARFRRNPIMLWGHDRSMPPIGRWDNVRVEGGKLCGRAVFAERGTSARIDELRALAEQGLLPATSVGFRVPPGEIEIMPGGRGSRIKKAELVECSLVSVPSNPNALQMARSLGVSDATLSEVFGESAVEDLNQRGAADTGEIAKNHSNFRNKPMNPTISQRIELVQADILKSKDDLNSELGKEAPDFDVVDNITGKIEADEANLARLQRSERVLATRAEPTPERPAGGTGMAISGVRPFAAPAKKVPYKDLIVRAAVSKLRQKATGEPLERVVEGLYGNHEDTMLYVRTAVAPAVTTTSGWASELVNIAMADFIDSLQPVSVYAQLTNLGRRFSFDRNGQIKFPVRSATPTIAGSFVGEGSPIPVKKAGLTSVTLTPKKVGVITTFTREMVMQSTPAIEGLVRDWIQEDTATALDSILLGTGAADSATPAGLLNGVSAAGTATSGGGVAAVVGDVKMLANVLIGANGYRRPVWIMNPQQNLALGVTTNNGFFNVNEVFTGERIVSTNVTAGRVILIDAADFVSALGDAPEFDVSEQAVLHMEDTTPLAIGTTGTPNTVAAPVRSLWQTASIGVRMLMDANWSMLRTGMVTFVNSVTW